jgi:hypothetical protein
MRMPSRTSLTTGSFEFKVACEALSGGPGASSLRAKHFPGEVLQYTPVRPGEPGGRLLRRPLHLLSAERDVARHWQHGCACMGKQTCEVMSMDANPTEMADPSMWLDPGA